MLLNYLNSAHTRNSMIFFMRGGQKQEIKGIIISISIKINNKKDLAGELYIVRKRSSNFKDIARTKSGLKKLAVQILIKS